MARGRKGATRRAWTAQDERALKKYSKSKTPVKVISKTLKFARRGGYRARFARKTPYWESGREA